MPESLTKAQSRVWDATGGMEPPEKMREIIDALHETGFKEEIDQKSNLISDNIKGIVQIKVHNATLQKRFGIRINTRDVLCDSKLRVVATKGNAYTIAIVNKDVDILNITLNTTGYTGYLMDVETGKLYDTSSGSVNIGDIDGYDIRYFSTPYLDKGNCSLTNAYGERILQLTEGVGLGTQCTVALQQTCTGTLSGLQSFGDFVPLLIIVLVVVVVFGFLLKGEGSISDLNESSVGVIFAIVAVALGAVIISSMLGGC